MEEKIELRKVRDFGELINDTFVFVKQNLKPLLKAYVAICGFFIVALILSSILQQLQMQEAIKNIGTSGVSKVFGVEYFLTLIFSLISFIAISVFGFCYVCQYRDKGNIPPTVEEVWGYFKYFFVRMLWAHILLSILMMIGLFLCFIPGIYLWPIISIIYAIMIFENSGLGYAFDRGFKLVKNNWWTTFGALFIILLCVYFASMVLIIPASLITTGGVFFGNYQLSTVAVILTSVAQSIIYAFMLLLTIVISLSYFSLVEGKEGSGLLDRINMIGKDDANKDYPEEQY